MTMMISSTAALHFLVKDDQNEMQHDFFSHLKLLALESASCDANGIVNNTTVLIRSGQLKEFANIIFLVI